MLKEFIKGWIQGFVPAFQLMIQGAASNVHVQGDVDKEHDQHVQAQNVQHTSSPAIDSDAGIQKIISCRKESQLEILNQALLVLRWTDVGVEQLGVRGSQQVVNKSSVNSLGCSEIKGKFSCQMVGC